MRRDQAVREHGAQAFEWLDERLQALLERGRALLVQLGPVRDADAALDSPEPARARDALRALRALAVEYGVLRETQCLLTAEAARWASERWLRNWSDQVAVIADFGSVRSPGEVGQPPADPFDQLVWLLEGDPAPQPFVPDYNELQRRVDAAKATDQDDDEPADDEQPYVASPP